jgi:tetratricopeptide (TPR) repeat protein
MGLTEGPPDAGSKPSADAAGRLVLQATDLVVRGDLDGAIAAYSEALRLDPRSTAACLGRGVARSRKGQFAQAIADATEALRIDPRHAPAYRNRGRDHAAAAAWSKAIADFTEAIRLAPDDARAYSDRATILNRLGRHAQAITDATDAIRLDPGLALGHNARGYGHFGRGRQRVFTFWRRGNAEARRADFKQAVADFTEAIRLAPDSWDCFVGRAAAYRALGDLASAARDEAALPPQVRQDPRSRLR